MLIYNSFMGQPSPPHTYYLILLNTRNVDIRYARLNVRRVDCDEDGRDKIVVQNIIL